MSEKTENTPAVEEQPDGLDHLIEAEDAAEQAEQRAQQEEKAKAEQPTHDDIERAKAFASQLNGAFLFGVDKVVCPSIDIGDHVDPSEGDAKLLPLALAMGGEIPTWLKELIAQWGPYVGAGLYMGTTIYQARKLELAERERAEKAERAREQPQPARQPQPEGRREQWADGPMYQMGGE
ncbi:hypothetical protein HBA55_34500 [Pseudomaricurvus alkylphenolicus]|uniref:hypothetical protein n=1 Tax=Pseudomaricurvus alkylphenolicus TaxID=1306991 RepID=UPI001420A893|nr:hypothetical protein [Pseudomaricurvus alkylphenolicus]NIB44742.1 hypothetical protein [Pseudomaricurvus alkylphenolicus]